MLRDLWVAAVIEQHAYQLCVACVGDEHFQSSHLVNQKWDVERLYISSLPKQTLLLWFSRSCSINYHFFTGSKDLYAFQVWVLHASARLPVLLRTFHIPVANQAPSPNWGDHLRCLWKHHAIHRTIHIGFWYKPETTFLLERLLSQLCILIFFSYVLARGCSLLRASLVIMQDEGYVTAN